MITGRDEALKSHDHRRSQRSLLSLAGHIILCYDVLRVSKARICWIATPNNTILVCIERSGHWFQRQKIESHSHGLIRRLLFFPSFPCWFCHISQGDHALSSFAWRYFRSPFGRPLAQRILTNGRTPSTTCIILLRVSLTRTFISIRCPVSYLQGFNQDSGGCLLW